MQTGITGFFVWSIAGLNMVYIGIHTGFFMVFRAFSPRVPPAGKKREVCKPLVLLGLQPFFRRRNSPRFPHACTRFVPLLLQFFGIFCCILSFFGKKENPRNPCNCWGFGDFPVAGAEGLEPSARGFGVAVRIEKATKILPCQSACRQPKSFLMLY